jgi:hypothetical protein
MNAHLLRGAMLNSRAWIWLRCHHDTGTQRKLSRDKPSTGRLGILPMHGLNHSRQLLPQQHDKSGDGLKKLHYTMETNKNRTQVSGSKVKIVIVFIIISGYKDKNTSFLKAAGITPHLCSLFMWRASLTLSTRPSFCSPCAPVPCASVPL